MQETVGVAPLNRRLQIRAMREQAPTLAELSVSTGSALLLVLSFPDFDLWPLAWFGLVPFLMLTVRPSGASRSFFLGWLWGIVFFYGTCWWLTYPMIHYGQISSWFAYPLLILPVAVVAVFPGLFGIALNSLVSRFGTTALFFGPIVWVSLEWARYMITGQVWNAIGYSQAFKPELVQTARWGGVYAPSFLILTMNVAIAFFLFRRTARALWSSLAVSIAAVIVITVAAGTFRATPESKTIMTVVAVQPNVPMQGADDPARMKELIDRHLQLSAQGLNNQANHGATPSLLIWPESPMNFSYTRDNQLRTIVADLAQSKRTYVLLNSLEPAPNGGDYNSAILVNEKGEIAAQYDKIRLMPFGEYVPLPRWLPGASSVRAIVGEFTPGSSYPLMPLGDLRAGVFICIEAAHPLIARTFTNEGAEVLINISNDGYLGPTPVMRQHLANAVFRAVENDRDLLRVTNSGITALISSTGAVYDQTTGFHEDVRTWTISKSGGGSTFYSRHGDVFVYGCGLISLGFISASFMRRRVE